MISFGNLMETKYLIMTSILAIGIILAIIAWQYDRIFGSSALVMYNKSGIDNPITKTTTRPEETINEISYTNRIYPSGDRVPDLIEMRMHGNGRELLFAVLCDENRDGIGNKLFIFGADGEQYEFGIVCVMTTPAFLQMIDETSMKKGVDETV